jgi:hypothetical protein
MTNSGHEDGNYKTGGDHPYMLNFYILDDFKAVVRMVKIQIGSKLSCGTEQKTLMQETPTKNSCQISKS